MIPVVSFFTKNTPYEQEAEEMKASALDHGVEQVYLYPVDSLGEWTKNCAQKPTVLLQACSDLKRPFLYLDVDARFKQYPLLFDYDWTHYDIGAHYFKKTELLSGTLYINPTSNTISLLKNWESYCKLKTASWDQRMLEKAVQTYYGKKRIWELPPEYVFIYDHSKRQYPYVKNPVIIHYQASRKYKKLI